MMIAASFPVTVRAAQRPRLRLIRAAQWCGLLPALLGTVIVFSWVQTASTLLPLLGALNVVLGLTLFGIGLGLLYGLYLQAGRRHLPGTGLAIVLLLANFPLAVGYGVLAARVEERRLHEARCTVVPADAGAEPTGLADARRRPC
ncbi:hypothetical protein [Chitinimonas naiadis]